MWSLRAEVRLVTLWNSVRLTRLFVESIDTSGLELIFVLWCTKAFLTVLKFLKDSVWSSKQRKNLNPVFDSAFEVQMVSVGDCAFVVSRIASVLVARNDFNVDFRDAIVSAVVIAFFSSWVVLVGLPVVLCPASVTDLIVSCVFSAGFGVVMSYCVGVKSAV